jgi:predicted transcriptional regulator
VENHTTMEGNLGYLPFHKKYDLCGLPLRKKYRSHFEIIALILDAAKDNGEDRYTLMKHTGVNYAQLKKYLESLAQIGFINANTREGIISYKATEKGLGFLRQYYVLLAILLSNQTTNAAYETNRNANLQTVLQRPK